MSSFAADFREGVDINLGVGYVNENTIPRAQIQEALGQVLGQPGKYKSPLNYGGPRGSPSLIESIRHYHVSRGVGGLTESVLSRKEIIIGPNGATSLLEGLAHVLRPGIVLTSDPMYYIYCDFLERKGFTVITIPEHLDGLHADDMEARIEELGEHAGNISFIYVVTVNNPSATIISNKERAGLVRAAVRLSRRLGRIVPLILDKAYEDMIHDPAVEKPRSGLLDDEEGVVYEIGTLSKIIAPSLRIGYIVFPPELVNRGREVKWFTDLHNSSVDQLILARFIAEGHFVRHVHAMKKAHRAHRRALVDSLRAHFGSAAEVLGSSAGLHLCARFAGARLTAGLLARIESAGVKVYPVEEHAIKKGRWRDTLILGYGMLGPRRMDEGIAILRRCLMA